MTRNRWPEDLLKVDKKTNDLIIGTMDKWLAGKPVWRLATIQKKWGPQFDRRGWSFGRINLDVKNMMIEALKETKLTRLRLIWIERFGFAIPCAELIETCRKYAPILDVGAGTGYMTKLMRNAGIEATGTDAFKYSYAWRCGVHDKKQKTIKASSAIKASSERTTVFCSWPSYDETWFHRALMAMHPGQRLIVIRESATGNKSSWDYLDKKFEQIETIQIPCWPYMHDRCEVWIKKLETGEDKC